MPHGGAEWHRLFNDQVECGPLDYLDDSSVRVAEVA
jgi:hypothetical protein